jgi:hypothetical protein
MIRSSGGIVKTFLLLVCVCVFTLTSNGCQSEQSNAPCLSVGEGFGAPINGGLFLAELMDIYGQKFSREFMRRRAIERKAKALNVELPKGQVDSEMVLTKRDFFASHSGEKAAVKHLQSYGISLEDWQRLTTERVRYGLLAKRLMRTEPSQKMIDQLFEKRYGRDGERREIRYLYVSTKPTSQSIIQGETLKAKLKAFEAKIHQRLSDALKVNRGRASTGVAALLSDVKYSMVPALRHTDLPLDVAKKLEGIAPGVWSEVRLENEQLKSIRRQVGPNSATMASARFEQIVVPVSARELIVAELQSSIQVAAKVRAQKLFSQLNKSPRGFSIQARAMSDHAASKPRGGRFRIFQPKNAGLSPKATEAVLKLKHPGELVMVEDATGFHIVRLESLTQISKAKVLNELLGEMKRRDYSDVKVNEYIDTLVDAGGFNIRLELDPRCKAKVEKP